MTAYILSNEWHPWLHWLHTSASTLRESQGDERRHLHGRHLQQSDVNHIPKVRWRAAQLSGCQHHTSRKMWVNRRESWGGHLEDKGPSKHSLRKDLVWWTDSITPRRKCLQGATPLFSSNDACWSTGTEVVVEGHLQGAFRSFLLRNNLRAAEPDVGAIWTTLGLSQ